MTNQPREPNLHDLLNQFENIGGPEVYGPEGIALLIALWRKSSKLGWKESYTMTNTEITVQTGIKSRDTISIHRSKLVKDGLIGYTPPPRGKSHGEYTMNFCFNHAAEPVQKSDHLSSNYTKPVGQLVQNSDHFSGNLGKPVRESDHLADTVLKDFKILIDRLIDGLEDERLKLSAGVLTTVEASMPLEEIALEEEPVAKRAVRIETYFNQRKGRLHGSINDWEQVHALAKEPIPEAFIFFAIDLAFARHGKTKRNPSEEINQFSYCRKVVDSVWFQLQNNLRAMSQTTPVPSGTVSRGQALKSKQALKNQEAKQKIREAEERERARSQENLHADPEHEWQL